MQARGYLDNRLKYCWPKVTVYVNQINLTLQKHCKSQISPPVCVLRFSNVSVFLSDPIIR